MHLRAVFCYMARHESDGCDAKQGNPFGPFWDTFQVDFPGSEMFGPLSYDQGEAGQWGREYPPHAWPGEGVSLFNNGLIFFSLPHTEKKSFINVVKLNQSGQGPTPLTPGLVRIWLI